MNGQSFFKMAAILAEKSNVMDPRLFLEIDALLEVAQGLRGSVYNAAKKKAIRKYRSLLSVRPRWQRAFLTWFFINREKYDITLHVTRRTKRRIDLSITGISKIISISFECRELTIRVMHDNKYFGSLYHDDTCRYIHCPTGGYSCTLNFDTYGMVYPTKTAMWEAHLFKAILHTLDRIAVARWIRLFRWKSGQEGECTGARLLYNDEDRYCEDRELRWFAERYDFKKLCEIKPGSDRFEFWIYPITGDKVVEHFEGCLADEENPVLNVNGESVKGAIKLTQLIFK